MAKKVVASLQTGGYGAQLLNLLSLGPCKAYEELKKQYNFGYKGKQVIRAIMGPFVSNDFNPPAQGGSFEADTIL